MKFLSKAQTITSLFLFYHIHLLMLVAMLFSWENLIPLLTLTPTSIQLVSSLFCSRYLYFIKSHKSQLYKIKFHESQNIFFLTILFYHQIVWFVMLVVQTLCSVFCCGKMGYFLVPFGMNSGLLSLIFIFALNHMVRRFLIQHTVF